MADFFDDTPLTTSRDPRGSTGTYQLDPRAVRAVMMQESGGNVDAVGKAGEIGLMQIMPKTGQMLGFSPESLRDPQTNLQAGTTLLNRLYTKYRGDLSKTFAAYNAGEGAVDRGKIPASTQKYVADVLARMGRDTGPARPNVFAQTQIDPRGSAQGASPAVQALLSRLQGAWGPGTAQAAEGPPTADIRSQTAPAGGLTPITGGTPLGAGAGLHPTFGEPDSPRARMVLDAIKHGLQMPDLAMRVPARILYRTMLSGTPWTVSNQPPYSTAPQWVRRNLPAAAGLDPQTGRPRWGVQGLQRGAGFGADLATDLVEARLPVPAEKMLGLESPYSTLTRKMRDLELQQRLARLEELARDPRWREAFETVRRERPIMAAERATQQVALPAAQRGMRRWVLDPGSGYAKGDVKELLRGLMGASLQQQRQQPSAPAPTPTAPISPLSRLEAAWAPGTAQAAEPSAADIERDKARRTGTGGPPTTADIAADKARRTAPDEANAPWPVRAAGWAPLITQTAGDVALSTLAAPAALTAGTATGPVGATAVESVASGIGSGAGYIPGELLNRGVREVYGYPVPSWSQEGWDTGKAAAWGAAFGPIFKLLHLGAPATLKAGVAAKAETKEAETALESLRTELGKSLGVTRQQARAIALQKGKSLEQIISRWPNIEGWIDKLPANVRERALEDMRRYVGTFINKEGEFGATPLQQLVRMKKALRRIPDRMYYRLYNASRDEIENLIDTTAQNYGKFYRFPDMAQAVRDAVDNAPRGFRDKIMHHFGWMFGGMGLYYTIRGGAAHLLELTAVLGAMLTSSALINSPPARALYKALLESKAPPVAARIAQALMSALATRVSTRPEQAPAEEPAAAPEEPAAAPTPSAPSAPTEPPPAPPSESTLEVPSEPTATPTPEWTE